WVIHWYQSEFLSSHSAAGTVGQPISTWKPAMAAPKRKPSGKGGLGLGGAQPRAKTVAARARRVTKAVSKVTVEAWVELSRKWSVLTDGGMVALRNLAFAAAAFYLALTAVTMLLMR